MKNIEETKGVFRFIRATINRNRLGEILVMAGIISPRDLRTALEVQKETGQPLGQVLLRSSAISRRQLAFILARQYALRCVVALLFCFVSIGGVSTKKARAGTIKDVPAQISVGTPVSYTHMISYPGLFGTDEKQSRNLSAFTKWVNMFSRFDRELKDESSKKLMVQWQENLSDFKELPLKDMAQHVNAMMNKTRYVVDSKNWGKSDYWATPVEFLKYGGDCEDFAIAKYAALRALGVPEERLRIAIVHDNQKNIPHALLVVYTDQGSYYLDNQSKTIVNAQVQGRYRPIFSINREAWWLHSAPNNTIIASAR